MSTREESHVATPDGALHVVSEGRGPDVFILHGFTGSTQSMLGIARSLQGEFRVHRIDLLGFGQSDAPREFAAYTMERCTQQLVCVQGALNLPRAHLLGYSMGGRVALSYAVSKPSCVASLILVGATAGLADAAARAERVASDAALAQRILDEGLEAFVDDWMALPLFASQKRLGETALARARAERLCNRPHALAASLRGMGTGAMPPLHRALPGLDLPVLLVVGDEDEKFRCLAEQMATALPRARLELVARSGHAVHLEQPEAFGRVVRRFLSLPSGEGPER
jgi:2-succinyl-6-hydroxy-2,4-cyclohexadiene-1-carboxylate synthase